MMMKRIGIPGALLAAVLSLNAGTLLDIPMRSPEDLSGFSRDSAATVTREGLSFELTARSPYRVVRRDFDPAQFSGRFFRLSCEVKAENVPEKKKPYEGIKVLFSMQNAVRKSQGEIFFPDGSFGWRKFQTDFPALPNLQSISLSIGMQNSMGKFTIRNLKLETVGIPVSIRSVANMALKDEVAGDRRGGWTDQGPKRDGSCFYGFLFRKSFAGVPIDAEPDGKGVLVMHSTHFPSGPQSVSIPVKPAEKAKYLYLLHTMAWGPAMRDQTVGTVLLEDESGKTERIPVRRNRDVADWYRHIASLPNGYAVLRGRTGDDEAAAVYLSRFRIDAGMGKIVSVEFQSNPEAIWLILGATLSTEDIPLPSVEPFTVKADSDWLPLPQRPGFQPAPGSALDLSPFMRPGTVDQLGRVVIRNGHFEFEKQPGVQVRFLADAFQPDLDLPAAHAEIECLAALMRRSGYNMVRTHFLDSALMAGAEKNCEFNPDMLDRLDYFIACMKKNGIYLNFDCMTSWIGYTPGNIRENNDPVKSFKSRIYFDPAVRENWRRGVEKFLLHKNPYTGTRLIDDPVLVMAVAYNEQEFGLWRKFDPKNFLPKWREFLKDKYRTVDQLHRAWGMDSAKFKTFGDIPVFSGKSGNYRDSDVAEFLFPIEQDQLHWYAEQLKQMGFKGYLTGFNCGKTLYFNLMRKDLPLVAMNHYFAHPSAWVLENSFINQRSAIGDKAVTLRNFIGTRQPGKPFVVTEQNFVFWNRFRYEQGFVIGGYAAFQDFDALTCHASQVNLREPGPILSFEIQRDPIAKVSEFLTYFLFISGDVTAAKPKVRIRAVREDVFTKAGFTGGLSTAQSLPALLVGESVECTENGFDPLPLRPGEIAFKLGETDSISVNAAGFSGSKDNSAASIAEMLAYLRKTGGLPASNRSDGKSVFETDTGELLLDSSRNFMRIDTPRFQGVCAKAGTKAELADFRIETMTADGCLALVAVDGMKPIVDASRLVLTYATNALNSGMTFSDRSMVTLLNNGHAPVLLRRGAFTVAVRNRNAAKLKLYVLDSAGNRTRTVAPCRIDNSHAVFSVDTGKDGAAVWFEIAAK